MRGRRKFLFGILLSGSQNRIIRFDINRDVFYQPDLCGCKPVPDRFDGFSGKSSWQENFLIPDEFPEKHKRSDEFSE